jgi:uncharacterized RDD family membrane protein YckC
MPTHDRDVADRTTPAAAQDAPGLWQRLAGMLYEGVLLFGLVVVVGLVYGVLTQQRHALQGALGLQALLFVALGVYFVGFWTHGGQTLAMKTWHLRLLRADGRPVTLAQAIARYLASWLWFLPALGGVALAGLRGSGPVAAALAANVGVIVVLARLHPSRQFLHDLICGTRIVSWRPPPRR